MRQDLASMPAHIQAVISDICDEYESAWQRGDVPSLGESSARVAAKDRKFLLGELTRIELHYRRNAEGNRVSTEELLAVYPEIASELSEIFDEEALTETGVMSDTHSSAALKAASVHPTRSTSSSQFAQLPTKFGRYEIIQPLGDGGMGSVFLAKDTSLERMVALKLPKLDSHSEPKLVLRFHEEAKAAATLNHPNLCSVFDVDQVDGVHYLTMEYIEGTSLDSQLKSRCKYDDLEVALLIRRIAGALKEAHSKGVIHRDLKPANIMVNHRGDPVVTDFGLAQRNEKEGTQITEHGEIMGTPSYMSPEQVNGETEKIGPASDVYSLGVIMYELLAGRKPYQGSPAAIFGQIMTIDPPTLKEIRPEIDSELQRICQRMMARDRDQRMPSMEEVIQELDLWTQLSGKGAAPVIQATPEVRVVSTVRTLSITGVLFVIVLGAVIFSWPSGATIQLTVSEPGFSVLLDEQDIVFNNNAWEGQRIAGRHRLELKLGEQSIPFGETTTVMREGVKWQVVANITGIELDGNNFELGHNSNLRSTIHIEWLDNSSVEKQSTPIETDHSLSGSTTQQSLVLPGPETWKNDRSIAQRVIRAKGTLTLRMYDGSDYFLLDSDQRVPETPFFIEEIAFENEGSVDAILMKMLSRLNGLRILRFAGIEFSANDFEQCQLPPFLVRLEVLNPAVKVSSLHSQLEKSEIRQLQIGNDQIDDRWEFLGKAPLLSELNVNSPTFGSIQSLIDSDRIKHESLRTLILHYPRKITDEQIEQLQKQNDSLTVVAVEWPRWTYWGNPVQQKAAQKLVNMGFTLEANLWQEKLNRKIYSQGDKIDDVNYFYAAHFSAPDQCEISPEIVDIMKKLPLVNWFSLLNAKNTDLFVSNGGVQIRDWIDLRNTDITDSGLKALTDRNCFSKVILFGTTVTQQAVRELHQSQPFLRIPSQFGTYHFSE